MKRVRRAVYSFFVPHEGNNYRARSLHHAFLLFYLAIGVFLFTLTSINHKAGNVLGIASNISVTTLLDETNEKRKQYNLPPLTLNSALSRAAAAKASDMFAEDYWAHFSPDGASPWDFFKAAGYDYEYAGENLAKNFMDSEGVVTAWMDSPSHRENILRPEYSQVGYAVVNGNLQGEPTTLVVQFFGKPSTNTSLAQAPAPQLTPPPPQQTTQVAAATSLKKPLVPLGAVSILIFFLAGALILDLYFASRLNVIRFHGKNLAHIIFLIFIFAGFAFFISQGAIL